MLGNIIKIYDNKVYIKLNYAINTLPNLMNRYVLFQDEKGAYVGEILNVENLILDINLVGEFNNNYFVYGVTNKPSINAKSSLIADNYINNLISYPNDRNAILIGNSPYYKDISICANINSFFGSHMAIFGSTGSGKSCGYARIIQNLIAKDNISEKMNLIIFDAYGEYHQAFAYLNEKTNYVFKTYTTEEDSSEELIKIPPWLLDADDYALLLNINNKSQMAIIEKALRNISLFKKPESEVLKYKNNIIANALLDILLSGRPAAQIRDQIISALSKFYTVDINLDTIIAQPGYNRTLRQCLIIDENNKLNAIELIANFFRQYIIEEVYSGFADGTFTYTLQDFSDALDFALIDEGIWKSEKIFDEANILKVRLKSLINSPSHIFFEFPHYVTKYDYLKQLLCDINGRKAQIINFNISGIDDRLAKTIVKIYSKLFFNYVKSLKPKANFPINIFLEEAHRYVQNDDDVKIIGYNIFERITKEGRKYGILLGLISQRPYELSETCLSQCNNFVLFKMTHPLDIDYVSKVIPNITKEIIEKIKNLQPGYAIVFGNAFKIPTLVKIPMPNPTPSSSSCEISKLWFR